MVIKKSELLLLCSKLYIIKIFAKKPTNGGTPANEKNIKTLEKDQIGFVLKKPLKKDKKVILVVFMR